LFSGSGYSEIVCGVYDGAWHSPPSPSELESEWAVLEEDLAGILSQSEIAALKIRDQAAREKGTRLIYVPTFYAWGKVRKTG